MRSEKEIEERLDKINDLVSEHYHKYKYNLYLFSLLKEIRETIHLLNSMEYDGKREVEKVLRWVLGESEE